MKIAKQELKEMIREAVKEQLSPDESQSLADEIIELQNIMKDNVHKSLSQLDAWEAGVVDILKKMEEKNLLTSELNDKILKSTEEMAELGAKVWRQQNRMNELILKIKTLALAGKK